MQVTMKRKTILSLTALILVGLLVGYIWHLKSATEKASSVNKKVSVNQEASPKQTVSFSLHDPDEVIKDTLLNPFVSKTKIKILGDSITAGRGSTGYGLTKQRIGNSQYFVPKQDSLSWANLVKHYVESKYNNRSVLVNPWDSRIISNRQRFEDNSPDAKLQRLVYTREEDARWKFTFTGTEFKLYFTKYKNAGIVDIYVDGKLMEQYDLYSPSFRYGYKVPIKDLKQGQHSVEIRAAGRNSDSIGSRIYLEAIEFHKTASVKNWGVSGRDSAWLDDLKDTLIEPDDDVVMIQIGSNDRKTMDSPEALKMHLQSIIEKCIREKKEVILLSANPALPKQDKLGANRHFTMQDVDATIKDLADEYGITYISNYDAFYDYESRSGTPIDELLKDGQHPNDAGYRVIYDNVMKSLHLSLQRD